MKIPPTPKSVLIHSVGHKRYLGRNIDGDKKYDTETTIKYVRIKLDISVNNTTAKGNPIGNINDTKNILYYDINSSSPKNIIFNIDDIIIYNEKEYKIISIKGDYSHHYEIELI